MDYIAQTLGLEVTYTPWAAANDVPYFIADRYEITRMTIGSADALMLTLKTELPNIGTLKKHIARIQKAEAVPVVVKLESITRYCRDTLIKAGISFVVPGKQLYLPFLGAVLSERYEPKAAERMKLIPSAQVLFLYCLYGKRAQFYIQDAVRDLGYSAMSVSRAARQLVQTSLFEEHKKGVQKILSAKYDRKELFRQMLPYLIDPVKRRIYLQKDLVPDGCKLAGFSAMAQYSMLNEPAVPCYAADVSAKLTGMPTLLNAETQVEIEIWKYDPAVLSENGFVDPLSLVLSLREDADERTEEAIEEIMEKFWEDQ